MKGIFIQSINKLELEESIRKIISQELLLLRSIPTTLKDKPEEAFLTKKQAAAFLCVSLPTLSKMMKSGFITGYALGKSRYRFKKSDLEKNLQKRK